MGHEFALGCPSSPIGTTRRVIPAPMMESAGQACKALTDLEKEANKVLADPKGNELTLVTSMKDVLPMVAAAKKSDSSLAGILTTILRASQ